MTVEQCSGECVRADGPDSVDLGPALRAGLEKAGDTAEPIEQDTGGSSRDPRYRGEDLDAGSRRRF